MLGHDARLGFCHKLMPSVTDGMQFQTFRLKNLFAAEGLQMKITGIPFHFFMA
jgi:hypothetical protein